MHPYQQQQQQQQQQDGQSRQNLQSLHETIDAKYLITFQQYIANPSPPQHSLSTIVHGHLSQLQQQEQYGGLLGVTQHGDIVVPVCHTTWLSLGRKRARAKGEHISVAHYGRSEIAGLLVGICELVGEGQGIYQYQLMVIDLQESQKTLDDYFGIILDQDSTNCKFIQPLTPPKTNHQQAPIKPLIVAQKNKLYLAGFESPCSSWRLTPEHRPFLNKHIAKKQGTLNLGSENIGVEGLEYIKQSQSHILANLNLCTIYWDILRVEYAGTTRGAGSGHRLLPPAAGPRPQEEFYWRCWAGLFWGCPFFGPQQEEKGLFSQSPQDRLETADNNLTSALSINERVFPSLQRICLSNNKITLQDPQQPQLAPLPHLVSLTLNNNMVTGQGLSTLHLPSLKFLHLANNNIVTCEPLSMAYLPNLKLLALEKNKISSVKWLKKCNFAYSGAQNLVYLNLSDNEIIQIDTLYLVDWGRLEQIRFNSTKRIDLIKEENRINSFIPMCKWNLIGKNEALNSQSIKLAPNLKKPQLSFSIFSKCMRRKLQPITFMIM